jgi:hypothetical protein
VGRLALGLALCLLAAPALASVFPVDLCESDPAGIEDLPGITEDEARALWEAAGPGPEDLAQRLASTGIDNDRLIEWAPYLSAGSTGAAWDIRGSAEGEGDAVGTVRQSIRVFSGRCRLEAAWKRSRRSPLGQEHAWFSYEAGRRTEIAAGALTARWTGPDPWEDPLARGRAVYGDDSDCVPAGGTGARGLSLRAPGLHCMGWTDAGAGRGWMGRVGGRRFWAWGATLSERGAGGGVGFALGPASVTCAAHAPSGSGRFLRVGIRAGRTTLALAAPIGGDPGSGTARLDLRSSFVAGRFTTRARGCFLQRSVPFSSRRSGTIVFERAGAPTRVALTGAWTGGGDRFSCRMERRLGNNRVRLTAGWWPKGGDAPIDLRLGMLRDAAWIQGESTITANEQGGEAGLHLSTRGSGGRVRMGVHFPLGRREGTPRWDVTIAERGG